MSRGSGLGFRAYWGEGLGCSGVPVKGFRGFGLEPGMRNFCRAEVGGLNLAQAFLQGMQSKL